MACNGAGIIFLYLLVYYLRCWSNEKFTVFWAALCQLNATIVEGSSVRLEYLTSSCIVVQNLIP